MRTSAIFNIAFGAVVAGLIGGAAFAQETPTPSSSTESFKDWTVECTTIEVKPKAEEGAAEGETPKTETRRLCEAVQTYRNQKTGNEVARFAFAYGGEDRKTLKAGMRLLVDVSFEKGLKITEGEKTVMEGKMARCIGSFCYATFDLKKGALEALQEAKKPAVQYPIGNGRMISINFSSRGLKEAVELLKSRIE